MCPQSAYFQAKISSTVAEYCRTFPDSIYPGTIQMATHITPNEERMKKLYLVFPGKYERTYSGLPALVVTAHQHHGSKTSLRVRVTNLISGNTVSLALEVSKTSRNANIAAMDKILHFIKKHMWLVGSADPDHYTE